MVDQSNPFEADQHGVAPAVFGAEYCGADEDDGGLAAPVYIPSERISAGDREARIELRNDEEGRLLMLAYSSLDLLVDGCGESQPWISALRSDVDRLREDCGAQAVLWDVELPADIRSHRES